MDDYHPMATKQDTLSNVLEKEFIEFRDNDTPQIVITTENYKTMDGPFHTFDSTSYSNSIANRETLQNFIT